MMPSQHLRQSPRDQSSVRMSDDMESQNSHQLERAETSINMPIHEKLGLLMLKVQEIEKYLFARSQNQGVDDIELEDLHLPITCEEDLNSLEEQLQDRTVRAKLV